MIQSLLIFLLLSTALCHANTATISIPPLQFSLTVHPASSTTTWSSLDLDAFSIAAVEFIDGHGLLQSSLGLNSGLEYGGVTFVASVSDGRGWLKGRRLQNTLDVTLKGTLALASATASYDILPTGRGVGEIVAALFQNGEQLFVKEIVHQAQQNGASEWLLGVTGYEVLLLESGAESETDANVNGIFSDAAATNAQPIPISSQHVISSAESDTQKTKTEASNNVSPTTKLSQANLATPESTASSMNLYIVVGITGAAISFFLLLAGLCYAKKSHVSPHKQNFEQMASSPSPTKKRSILKNNSQTTSPSSNPTSPRELDLSDEESQNDYMLAQAALNAHSTIQARVHSSSASVVSGAASSYADDMSYAFSMDGQSLMGGSRMSAGVGDVAIGAGGISAFQNESGGVFRWNEIGTKMVYIPATTNNAANEKAQNGFIYDEAKKKWVLEQKNVTFEQKDNADADSSLLTTPRRMQRVRTDEDSCITGFTEFSYDDVAVNKEPKCPSTPQDEGVEVGMEDMGRTTFISSDDSEFVPNTNVDKFMDDGDESTMFGSVLGGDTDTVTVPPPPPPLKTAKSLSPPASSPTLQLKPYAQSSTYDRTPSPDTSMITNVTLEPGVIKQKTPVIEEDKPFDEDIPFDEQSKPQQPSKQPGDEGSESGNSADSSHVLSDLNKLSNFMIERKKLSKSSRSSSAGHTKGKRMRVSTDYSRNKSLP